GLGHDVHVFCPVVHRAHVCGQLSHLDGAPPRKRMGAHVALHMCLFAPAAHLFLCTHRLVIVQLHEETEVGMKKTVWLGLCIIGLFVLSGCLYPREMRVENQMPVAERVEWVQEAVEAYHEDTGVFPIQTKDAQTHMYEKYPLDFQKLVPKYLPYIPRGAFEAGGKYQYVLVDPET